MMKTGFDWRVKIFQLRNLHSPNDIFGIEILMILAFGVVTKKFLFRICFDLDLAVIKAARLAYVQYLEARYVSLFMQISALCKRINYATS